MTATINRYRTTQTPQVVACMYLLSLLLDTNTNANANDNVNVDVNADIGVAVVTANAFKFLQWSTKSFRSCSFCNRPVSD